jgi:MoaA/NifB/PqqE/SkfB family radical SAM enzyme
MQMVPFSPYATVAEREAERELIRAQLAATPLRLGQIDVNGKCNAKCWYCPVKYQGNPPEFAVQMSVVDLDRILGQLRDSPLIPAAFKFLYSCHYNEVLLYRHFAELIPVFRKHGLATMILSNGTPLTPQKTDLILANPDVFWGTTLNIPALERDDWVAKAGMSASMHKLLLRNLDYLHSQGKATIQINCATSENGLLGKSMGGNKEEAQKIAASFRLRYPGFSVFVQEWLSDRAGKLEQHDVLTRNQKASRQVIGCSHSANDGGRIYGWVHINARGDLFLCCDDFDMEYCFGNLLENSFEEIWLSEAHIDAILRAQAGICRRCQFRIER